jgi:hypothetical protein
MLAVAIIIGKNQKHPQATVEEPLEFSTHDGNSWVALILEGGLCVIFCWPGMWLTFQGS